MTKRLSTRELAQKAIDALMEAIDETVEDDRELEALVEHLEMFRRPLEDELERRHISKEESDYQDSPFDYRYDSVGTMVHRPLR